MSDFIPDRSPNRLRYRDQAASLLRGIDETHAVEVIESDSDRLWHIRLKIAAPWENEAIVVYRYRTHGDYDRSQTDLRPIDLREFIEYRLTRADLRLMGRIVAVTRTGCLPLVPGPPGS